MGAQLLEQKASDVTTVCHNWLPGGPQHWFRSHNKQTTPSHTAEEHAGRTPGNPTCEIGFIARHPFGLRTTPLCNQLGAAFTFGVAYFVAHVKCTVATRPRKAVRR